MEGDFELGVVDGAPQAAVPSWKAGVPFYVIAGDVHSSPLASDRPYITQGNS